MGMIPRQGLWYIALLHFVLVAEGNQAVGILYARQVFIEGWHFLACAVNFGMPDTTQSQECCGRNNAWLLY